MALFTIKEGAHFHRVPPFSTLPWIGSDMMVRTVTFDARCQYDSPAYNGQDVNKLFGMSFGFGGVHHNSARFGWRWSKADQCIELLAYVYNKGQRNQDEQLRFPVVAQVQLGVAYKCSIDWEAGTHEFCVTGPGIDEAYVVPANNNMPGYGLTHGLYFGGELVAPHEMAVRIDRT